MKFTKDELYKNQYDLDTLKIIIYAVSLLDILQTQKLTAEFCVKYILNEDFQLLEEEKNINLNTVKIYQHHLTQQEFEIAFLLDFDKKSLFEDFESYMNRHL